MHEMQTLEKIESYSAAEAKTFYQPVQNPLWLDLILDRVFSFLPKSALANCRLVCRQWLEVSERYFVDRNHQSPTTVVVKDTDSVLSFLSTFVGRRDFDSDSIESPNSSPCVSYQLAPKEVNPFQQQLLMNICGDFMKRVYIDKYNDLELIHALSMFLRWTPQLESLELACKVSNDIVDFENQQLKNIYKCLETLKIYNRPFFTHLRRFRLLYLDLQVIVREEFEPFFSGLFQLMPRLQDFRILRMDLALRFCPDLVITAIIQALQVPIQVKVKVQEKGQVTQNSPSFLGQMVCLQLPYLTDQHFHDLHQFSVYNSLRLENFWLVNFWTCIDPQNLLTFLQGQAETLQKLCLSPYAAILFLHFPLKFTLDHVFTLKIFFWNLTLDECHLFVPHILLHFPNLKKLTICQPHGDLIPCTDVMTTRLMQKLAVEQIKLRMARSMSSNMVTCDQLTTINFSGTSSYQADVEFLTWLTKSCPNVTDLELRFSSAHDTLAVRTVFDGWRKLRRLVIYFFGWKDPVDMESYFTGIERQANTSFCISVMKKLQGRDWYIVHEYDKGREWENEKQSPSLLLLQDLRTLEIYRGNGDIDMEEFIKRYGVPAWWFLSDLTVLTTLIRMPRLREFCISHSSISPSVLRTLNDALDLEKCLVGNKEGKLIQFKVEVKDQTCDNGKGQVDIIDSSCGAQESANAEPRQSLERPSSHNQNDALSLLFGQESCCPIV